MLDCQLNKLQFDDGTVIELKTDIHGGISYEKGPEAWEFLNQHGYTVDWALNLKVAKEDLASLQQLLRTHGFGDPKAKPDIHAQTYKKICRELAKAGHLTDQAQQTLGTVTSLRAAIKTSE